MSRQDLFVANDFVLNENDCNLACEYCLTGQSNLKLEHTEQRIFKAPSRGDYGPSGGLREDYHAILENVDERFGIPLLKITGGEVFLIKNVIDFIERCARSHEHVILQTNGTLVRDGQLDRLIALGNVSLQISLDSHRHHGNSYRVPRASSHEVARARVEHILGSGIPVEIYCVINDRSVETLADFAAWMAKFGNHVVLYPFPVRGPDARKYGIRDDQIVHVGELLDRFDELGHVLPPRPYVERLVRFFTNGGRQNRCHLPRVALSTFGDGAVTSCPNIWFNILGDARSADWLPEGESAKNSGFYRLLTGDRPRVGACKKCYTPWEVVSLYFDDEITLAELCENPAYDGPRTRARLEALKKQYQQARRSREAVELPAGGP